MDQVVGKGVLVIAGKEIKVQYALKMIVAYPGRSGEVSGRAQGQGLVEALPAVGTVSGALRMDGGLELGLTIRRGLDNVAMLTPLKKPAA